MPSLIKSNNKIYSLKPNEILHETKMISNTAPTPFVASASSVYSSTYPAWKAFNGANANYFDSWASANGTGNSTNWIQIDFGSPKKINKLRITNRRNDQEPKSTEITAPKDFDILASDDGITFSTISEVRNQTGWFNNEIRYFSLGDVYNFRFYRIVIYSNNGISYNYVSIGQILFCYVKNLTQLPSDSIENFINHGSESIDNFDLINTSKNYILQKHSNENEDGFWVQELNRKPLSISSVEKMVFLLDGNYYTVNEASIVQINKDEVSTLGFNDATMNEGMYAQFTENPTIAISPMNEEDVTVSTTTEPFDLYDEFGDELEVLYYMNDESVNEANLILEANWSPIDELDGDFEIITWTDEPQETAQMVLEMASIPKPQFVKLINPRKVHGHLEDIIISDISEAYRNECRFLISDNGSQWYSWDRFSQSFIPIDTTSHNVISEKGMDINSINSLSEEQWNLWDKEFVSIGVFLKDNPRDTITSTVDSISYSDYLPRYTTEVEKGNFYILNTTAKIDITFLGNTLTGNLSDKDLGRVQYRVFLNDKPYFPINGEFTQLAPSPQNIELKIQARDIVVGDWNNIKVEFRDFFGTVDYWSTNFIGTYSGLLFRDIHGDLYSTDVGDILKYLDFGTIIAGQTTVEHEVILSNNYGFDIENIKLYVNNHTFPDGMKCEFSKSNAPFSPQSELLYSNTLIDGDELSFFVRLKSVLGTTPDSDGEFEIKVAAHKIE